MKNTQWAFTYLSRFLALLGFFLASSAFALTGYRMQSFPSDGCYSSRAYLCTVLAPVRYAGTEFAPDSYDLSCKYRATTGVMVGVPLQYCSGAQGTPTPSPSPTPDPCVGAAGKTVGNSSSTLTYSIGTTFETATNIGCLAGCKVLPSEIATGKNPLGQEIVFARGPFLNVGEKCDATQGGSSGQPGITPTPGPTPIIPPDLYEDPDNPSCKKGTCPGSVNGQNVCVPCDKTKTDTGTTVTEKPTENGNKEVKEVKSETICNGSVCVTIEKEKTTIKDTAGNTVGTPTTNETTKTEPADTFCTKNPTHKQCTGKDSFCKENPELSICKDGNWSETTCGGSAPVCTGDAVQCAQAANAFKTYCESKKTADALYGTGQGLGEAQSAVDSAMSFGSGSGSGSLLGDSGSVGIGSFNQSNPWSATCLADTQVAEFDGKAITIPFSKYCSVFELMGRIALAATLLAAGLFVFRD